MQTKILIEGLSFFGAEKTHQETFDGAATVGHYFFVSIPKVGSYQIATITFLIASEDEEPHHNLFSRFVNKVGKSSCTRWEHIFYEVPALFIIGNTSIVTNYNILIPEKQIINGPIFLT